MKRRSASPSATVAPEKTTSGRRRQWFAPRLRRQCHRARARRESGRRRAASSRSRVRGDQLDQVSDVGRHHTACAMAKTSRGGRDRRAREEEWQRDDRGRPSTKRNANCRKRDCELAVAKVVAEDRVEVVLNRRLTAHVSMHACGGRSARQDSAVPLRMCEVELRDDRVVEDVPSGGLHRSGLRRGTGIRHGRPRLQLRTATADRLCAGSRRRAGTRRRCGRRNRGRGSLRASGVVPGTPNSLDKSAPEPRGREAAGDQQNEQATSTLRRSAASTSDARE